MGAALYEKQQRALLERFQRVILMLDGDEAGRRATTAIAAQLRSYVPVRIILLPDRVQPDQLSAAAIQESLQAHPEREAFGATWQERT